MALGHPKESAGHSQSAQAAAASSGGNSSCWRQWQEERAEQEKQHLLGFSLCALTTLLGSSTRNAAALSPWEPHSLCRTKVNCAG